MLHIKERWIALQISILYCLPKCPFQHVNSSTTVVGITHLTPKKQNMSPYFLCDITTNDPLIPHFIYMCNTIRNYYSSFLILSLDIISPKQQSKRKMPLLVELWLSICFSKEKYYHSPLQSLIISFDLKTKAFQRRPNQFTLASCKKLWRNIMWNKGF